MLKTANAPLFLAVVAHERGAEWEKEWSLANSLLVSNKLFRRQVWIQIAGKDNGVGFLSPFVL